MVIQQIIRNKWIKTYSDENFFISEIDAPEILYVEAVDPINSGREYIETEVPIPEPDPEEEEVL